MNYNLTKNGGRAYYVKGLPTWRGDEDTLLIMRYDSGDVDTISKNGKNMHETLYDLYQTNDNLKEGDTFSLRGKVVYKCEGVHVVKITA